MKPNESLQLRNLYSDQSVNRMLALRPCRVHQPVSEEEEGAVLSSQSYAGLGKLSAGSGAVIFYHSHSLPAADGPTEPHSVVSAI